MNASFHIEYVVGESLGGSLGMTPCYRDGDRIRLCDGSYGLLDLVDQYAPPDSTPDIVDQIESEAMRRILAGETEGFISRSDLPTIMFKVHDDECDRVEIGINYEFEAIQAEFYDRKDRLVWTEAHPGRTLDEVRRIYSAHNAIGHYKEVEDEDAFGELMRIVLSSLEGDEIESAPVLTDEDGDLYVADEFYRPGMECALRKFQKEGVSSGTIDTVDGKPQVRWAVSRV